jgi:hypothetical protein
VGWGGVGWGGVGWAQVGWAVSGRGASRPAGWGNSEGAKTRAGVAETSYRGSALSGRVSACVCECWGASHGRCACAHARVAAPRTSWQWLTTSTMRRNTPAAFFSLRAAAGRGRRPRQRPTHSRLRRRAGPGAARSAPCSGPQSRRRNPLSTIPRPPPEVARLHNAVKQLAALAQLHDDVDCRGRGAAGVGVWGRRRAAPFAHCMPHGTALGSMGPA